MLITVGENTARECGITREESDDWSYHSNIRAVAATDDGRFAEEIVPVTVPTGRGETTTVSVDEHPRRRHDAGEAGGAALAHRARRAGHRRELLGHRRRWGRPRAGVPRLRRGARDDALGDGAVVELRGDRAGPDRVGPHGLRPPGPQPGRAQRVRRRPRRDQRGLRHHGGGLLAQAGFPPRHRQRQRWRRRHGPPRGRARAPAFWSP